MPYGCATPDVPNNETLAVGVSLLAITKFWRGDGTGTVNRPQKSCWQSAKASAKKFRAASCGQKTAPLCRGQAVLWEGNSTQFQAFPGDRRFTQSAMFSIV